MLSRQLCPHTGIVNYFDRREPFFAVGSITRSSRGPDEYQWRLYDSARATCGISADLKSAEQRLMNEYRGAAGQDNAPFCTPPRPRSVN